MHWCGVRLERRNPLHQRCIPTLAYLTIDLFEQTFDMESLEQTFDTWCNPLLYKVNGIQVKTTGCAYSLDLIRSSVSFSGCGNMPHVLTACLQAFFSAMIANVFYPIQKKQCMCNSVAVKDCLVESHKEVKSTNKSQQQKEMILKVRLKQHLPITSRYLPLTSALAPAQTVGCWHRGPLVFGTGQAGCSGPTDQGVTS